MVICCWMKGVVNAPDGKRPHSPRMGKTEGKHQKAGVVRHSRHEGLAPVRLSKGPETGSGLLRANSCRTSDRSACLFPQVPVPGLMSRDPWTPGFPFRAHQAPRPPSSDKYARASAIMKNGASPSPRLKRQGGTRNEDQGNDTEPACERAAPTPPVASFKAGSGAKIKKRPWGSA